MLPLMWRMACVAIAAVGCVTTTAPVHFDGPYRVIEKERFRVMRAGQLVGNLLYLEIAVPERPTQYYRLGLPGGAWVGDIHMDLSFYKSEPFRDTPRWLGIYPMKEGLSLMLETPGPLQILPTVGSGEATEAAALKLLREAMVDRDS
jgi:hypothetical protein